MATHSREKRRAQPTSATRPPKPASGRAGARETGTGPLHDARNRLADVVAALIEPRSHATENGTRWADSWYRQLRDALPGEYTHGQANHGSLPPLWLDAADVLTSIDRRVNRWEPRPVIAATCPDCGAIPDDWPTVQKLRAITARKWRPQDTQTIHEIADGVENATAKIAALFDPKPKYLPDPCPHCEQSQAHRRDSAGEKVRAQGALQITMKGCTCLNCGSHWPPEKLPLLGRMLGYPAPAGVVE